MTNSAEIIKFPDKENKQGQEFVKADIDNGYYRTANELGEALCKAPLAGREFRLVQAVMIKTFGWQKRTDWICEAQLSELTNIAESNISKIKASLFKKNILLKEGKKIGVNPVISEWDFSKNTTSQKQLENKSNPTCEQVKSDLNTSQIRPLQKKDTITKEKKIYVRKRNLKSELFKAFFNLYPERRRGGTNTQAYKAWTSEKLTDHDATIAIKWLTIAAKNDPAWSTTGSGEFVQGITKFIRERTWLTPIPQARQPQTDSNDISWAEGLTIEVDA